MRLVTARKRQLARMVLFRCVYRLSQRIQRLPRACSFSLPHVLSRVTFDVAHFQRTEALRL